MSTKSITALALSLAIVFCVAPFASAGKGEKGEHGPIEKIIKHKAELSLTSDQITKLEALEPEEHTKGKGKGGHKELKHKIEAILTADQIAKIKAFKEEHKKSK